MHLGEEYREEAGHSTDRHVVQEEDLIQGEGMRGGGGLAGGA